jgi:hypothetical protein
MPSGDDGVDILTQLCEIVFGHGGDDLLSVLVAKGGDEMKAPLAAHGRNHILRNGGPLLVSWVGGEGPFSVSIEGEKNGKAVVQAERVIDVPLGDISGSRFAVVVTDAHKRRLRIPFDFRKAALKAPEKVKARDNRGEIAAIWLASQQNGAWRFEAARQLRALPQDKLTVELIAALEKGWQPK